MTAAPKLECELKQISAGPVGMEWQFCRDVWKQQRNWTEMGGD